MSEKEIVTTELADSDPEEKISMLEKMVGFLLERNIPVDGLLPEEIEKQYLEAVESEIQALNEDLRRVQEENNVLKTNREQLEKRVIRPVNLSYHVFLNILYQIGKVVEEFGYSKFRIHVVRTEEGIVGYSVQKASCAEGNKPYWEGVHGALKKMGIPIQERGETIISFPYESRLVRR